MVNIRGNCINDSCVPLNKSNGADPCILHLMFGQHMKHGDFGGKFAVGALWLPRDRVIWSPFPTFPDFIVEAWWHCTRDVFTTLGISSNDGKCFLGLWTFREAVFFKFEGSLSYYGDCIFKLKSSVTATSPAPFLKAIDIA